MEYLAETTIEENGRIIIPIQIRRKLGIRGGDLLAVILDDEGKIVINPKGIRCQLCGDPIEDDEFLRMTHVCKQCLHVQAYRILTKNDK